MSLVRGLGKPRVKQGFGQWIAKVPRNIQRRIRKGGFSLSKGRKRVRSGRATSFGFGK